MPDFSEELLQFIWRHRLLKPLSLKGTRGEKIVVKHPGQLNRDSGPDFSSALIVVNGVLLSGNVEIHLRSSDWMRHGHHTDAAYDRLILHVVYEHDAQVIQNTENGVAVLELRKYIDQAVIDKYGELSSIKEHIPCAASIGAIPDHVFSLWVQRLGIERLEQRQGRLEQLLHNSKGNYMEVLYVILLSGFGFKVNALPFELLAGTLPVQILLRHASNLIQVEALLFGCAGLLDEQLHDQHLRNLQNEFEFLRRKYKLRCLSLGLLKFSRLRPANFPTLRLAQFASIIHHHPGLLSGFLSLKDREGILAVLRTPLSVYWQHHFSADGVPTTADLGLGEQSAENLVMNVFVPFYFFYGRKFSKEEYCELALDLLSQCTPEDNRKTRFFQAKKHLITSAAQSQGVLQLFDHYCERKRCLECAVGHAVISGAEKEVLQQ
jgi:hypothetical protein